MSASPKYRNLVRQCLTIIVEERFTLEQVMNHPWITMDMKDGEGELKPIVERVPKSESSSAAASPRASPTPSTAPSAAPPTNPQPVKQ